MNRAPDVSVEEFLSGCTPRVRRLAEAARQCILTAVPHATERVRPGWGLIGYNAPAYFAFIAPESDHVRIGFEWGVMLSDSSRLLEGSGNQVRYISVRALKDLCGRAVAEIIRSAAEIRAPRLGRPPR